MSTASIPEIIDELKAGRMVILVDEEDRENEGDLVLLADFVTPETINFMAKHGRGLICLTLTEERCRQLNLTPMTSSNGARTGTNFTVSIEAAEGVTTGISAADRARTIQVAVAANAAIGLVNHARRGTVKWPCASVTCSCPLSSTRPSSISSRACSDGCSTMRR